MIMIPHCASDFTLNFFWDSLITAWPKEKEEKKKKTITLFIWAPKSTLARLFHVIKKKSKNDNYNLKESIW